VAKTGFMMHVLLMEQVSAVGAADLEGILAGVWADALPKKPKAINTTDSTGLFNLMPP
jgi:hypothetical protein